MLGMLHANDRIVEAEDIWMKALEARTEDSKSSAEFDTRGVELILRGAEEQWNLALSSIRLDLSQDRIDSTSSSTSSLKNYVRDLFDWRPVTPDPTSKKELRPVRHIQLLRSGVILDNVVEFYSGEAHVHRAAMRATPFFSFIRLMSVWCLYLCKLGFRHEIVPVVRSLHAMGMAHRVGDIPELAKQRKHVEKVSTCVRIEAYVMLASQS
jgi:hypothetical protein